jgi:hypothetical protein
LRHLGEEWLTGRPCPRRRSRGRGAHRRPAGEVAGEGVLAGVRLERWQGKGCSPASGWRGGRGRGSTSRGGGWCARGPWGGASWAGEWPERPIDVDGLINALDDGLHEESKWGKGGRSTLERPQRWWRAAHLKKDGSDATPVASRPESGSAAWLQASARQNLHGGGEEHGELRRREG